MKNNETGGRFQLLLELLQPGMVTLTVGAFFIGVGLAHHLGGNLKWIKSVFLLFDFLFLLWARNLLIAYWDHPESPLCLLKSTHIRYMELLKVQRNSMLTYSLVCLTGAAISSTFVLGIPPIITPLAFLLLIIFILVIFSSLPPLLLQRKGYGELIESFNIFILLPATAVIINFGELTPLLELLTVPPFFVYLAGRLVFSLRTYLADKTGGNPNLLNRLDWEKAMRLHNALIIAAYILIGIFSFVGLPWGLTWPLLITLPIAVFEVLLIIGITRGGKPNWSLLEWTSGALAGSMIYLVLLTLWMH
jgi:1,4-dihydroxy-2-naphthoate octaprenyltransferase